MQDQLYQRPVIPWNAVIPSKVMVLVPQITMSNHT